MLFTLYSVHTQCQLHKYIHTYKCRQCRRHSLTHINNTQYSVCSESSDALMKHNSKVCHTHISHHNQIFVYIKFIFRKQFEYKINIGMICRCQCNSPGNFFVRKDALVIIDLDTVTVCVDGVSATLMPIGPSHGWPTHKTHKNPIIINNPSTNKRTRQPNSPDGLACNEFLIAFVTNIVSGNSS